MSRRKSDRNDRGVSNWAQESDEIGDDPTDNENSRYIFSSSRGRSYLLGFGKLDSIADFGLRCRLRGLRRGDRGGTDEAGTGLRIFELSGPSGVRIGGLLCCFVASVAFFRCPEAFD